MGRAALVLPLLLGIFHAAPAYAGDPFKDGTYKNLEKTDPDAYEKKKAEYYKNANQGESDLKSMPKSGKPDATLGMTQDQIQQYQQQKQSAALGDPASDPRTAAPVSGATDSPSRVAVGGGAANSIGGGHGGAASSRPTAVSAAPSAPGDAPPTEAGRQGDQAFGRASAAAQALKNQLRGPESLPDGAGGLAGAAGAQGGAAGVSASARAFVEHEPPSIANPKTTQDLALASMGGFGGAFKSMGLKVATSAGGAAAIVHEDGRPATAREVDGLKNLIASEPSALTRRADFLSVLPRERFEQLKSDYDARPALGGNVFKDVGMPATKRDFLWSASCSEVSGDCNKSAKEGSYKKGDYVPPEDLNKMWERIKANEGGDDELSADEMKQIEQEELSEKSLGRSVFKPGQTAGFLAGLQGMLGTVGAFFDGSSSSVRAGGGSVSAARGSAVGAVGARARRGETGGDLAGAPVAASAGPEASGGRLAVGLAILGAVALSAAGLLRRRKETQ